MELKLLHAFLVSRDAFESIYPHINTRQYSDVFAKVCDYVRKYYELDQHAKHIDSSILLERLFLDLRNDKHQKMFKDFVERASGMDTSAPNVQDLLLGAKRVEASRKLAESLINNSKDIDEHLSIYTELRAATSYDGLQGKKGIKRLSGLEDDGDGSCRATQWRLRLLPTSLDQRVPDRVGPGDHIVIYGEPEIGKSALAITVCAGFARQGAAGIWIENEENFLRTRDRFVFNLAGTPRADIHDQDDWTNARHVANQRGGSGIHLVDMTGYGFQEIERCITNLLDDDVELKWLAVNQIHNVVTKSDNEVLRREKCAQAVRDLAKKYDLIGVSVTQGDQKACEGKAFLEMGDVYMNNTGIQGTCDILLGIGATKEMLTMNHRGLSLPKNKISNIHDSWYVRIVPELTRVDNY